MLLRPWHQNEQIPVSVSADPPEIDDLPKKTKGKGDILMIRCVTKGTPIPYIQWQKVGSDAPYREGEQRVSHITSTNHTMPLCLHDIATSISIYSTKCNLSMQKNPHASQIYSIPPQKQHHCIHHHLRHQASQVLSLYLQY